MSKIYLCKLAAEGECPLEEGTTKITGCYHTEAHAWCGYCDELLKSKGCYNYTEPLPCREPGCHEYGESLAIKLAKGHKLRKLLR